MALDVVTVLQRLEPFSALDITALQALVTLGEEIEVQSGALVIQAGAVWDGLYVVTAGRVRLVNERTTGSAISIDTFQEGTYLGEHSFFAEVQAGFSVYGDAPETTLLRLSSARLAAFLAQHPALSQTFAVYGARRALEAFLASAATPVQLPVAQLVGWMQSWHTQTVQSGECLIREDDSPDALYIVLEGHFNVYQGTQPATDVRVLRRGDVIGDLSLVTGQRLPGNVVAATLATVWVIPKAEFLSLLLERQEFASSFDSLIPQAAPPPEAETAPQSTPAPADQAAPPPAAPEPASPRPVTKLPWRYRFGRLPAVRQQSTMDCGAACLATVCRYYGKRVSLNRMRDLAHVGTAGASMLDLMRAAITLGYDSEPYLATYDHLMAHALPAIVNWRGYHWIVVYQVTPKQVTVADPGQGVRTMSKDEFLQGWTRYTLYMQPTEALAALEDSPPTLRQFIPYVKPYKRVLYEILLASLSLQIFSLLMPLFTKFVIDEVITKQHVQWFVPGLVVLSGVMVLHTVLSYCRQRLLLLMSLKTMSQMVSDFYTRLLSLPLPFFERRKVGDITSRFEENQKITNFLTHVGLQSFLDLFTAFMYVGLMAYLNLHLTLVACSFVMFHILIVQYITPYLQHAYRDVFQKGADSQSFIIESLSGLRTLKTLGVEHMTRWRWEDLNIRFSNAYFQSLKFGSLSNLASGLVNNLSDVAVLFYGASMVLRNQLTLGELVAFTVLTQGLSAPLMKLVGLWDVFQETLTAVERLNDVLETAPEVAVEVAQNTITLPPLRGYVRFEHLTFRYAPDSKQNVLQNITLDVQPGQRVAFVGRSGSGKSTLLKLLCRFYRPSSGTIYLDGFDLAEVALPSLRPQIGIVPQNVVLFPGTIRDNIALARPDTGLAEVIEAAQLAVAHDFISTLPHGYDTVLAEGGSNLSGGQRQRLAIARAMLHAPRLLILDEATSALDNETERLILRNLDLRFKDRTVFMIAHRLSTVQHAHLIVVIEKGLIFEQGTHEELMAQRGLYYFLQTQQLSL